MTDCTHRPQGIPTAPIGPQGSSPSTRTTPILTPIYTLAIQLLGTHAYPLPRPSEAPNVIFAPYPYIGVQTSIHVAGLGAHVWGCLPSSRCAHFINPVRRARQARVVVIFQRHSLGSGGDWGFRAGLTAPFPGKWGWLWSWRRQSLSNQRGGSGAGRAQYLRCNLFHNELITLICSTSQLIYLRCKLIPTKFIK